MLNIAALGGSEFILGFQLAGIRNTIDTKNDPIKAAEQALNDPELGIVIVDEKTINNLDDRTNEKIEMSVKPVFIRLSTDSGAQDALRKMIRKSIGIDLWKD